MTPDRPLHVRVAEALGWRECQLAGNVRHTPGGGVFDERVWVGVPDWDRNYNDGAIDVWQYTRPVPKFDADWAAAGPLVERFEIDLDHDADWTDRVGAGIWVHAPTGRAEDEAYGGRFQYVTADGATPLEAVCNLILALHEAGKLSKVAA